MRSEFANGTAPALALCAFQQGVVSAIAGADNGKAAAASAIGRQPNLQADGSAAHAGSISRRAMR
jgi:hypothetical protein